MTRDLALGCSVLVLLVTSSVAMAVPSLMTYQGALTDAAGKPADGTYSMTFGMYSARTGGAAVWSETIASVKVTNGVFTVLLGATSALPAGLANCKWMQVTVDGTPMLPRQRLSSVPYALEAADAARLNGQASSYYQNARNLTTGTLRVARLPQVPAGKIASNAVTSAKIAPGAVGPTDLGDGAVTGAKIAVGAQVSGSAAGGFVFRGRNEATEAGSSGIEGVTAGAGALAVPAGVTGRSTAPSGPSYGVYGEVASDGGAGVYGRSPAGMGVYGESASDHLCGIKGQATSATGTTVAVLGEADSTEGTGVLGIDEQGTGPTIGVKGWVESDSGTGVYGLAGSPSGQTRGVYAEVHSALGAAVYATNTSTQEAGMAHGVYAITANPNGVGVEAGVTATEGSGSPRGVLGWVQTPFGTGVEGFAGAAEGDTVGVHGWCWSPAGTGVYGHASAVTGETKGVRGQVDSPAGIGVYGKAPGLAISGEVTGPGVAVRGLATAASGATYGVQGLVDSSAGTGVLGQATPTSGSTYGVYGKVSSPNGHAVHAYSENASGYAVYAGNGKNYFEDQVQMDSTLRVNGYAYFFGGHGDLAENYRADGVEAADVVVIDEDGRLVKCTEERDTRVAGIVSTQPSMRLSGRLDEGEGVAPLALVGRVACKVDATKHPIHAGDLLTTSSTPGHAMACLRPNKAGGAILGKALEDLETGTGIVQVLVTLR